MRSTIIHRQHGFLMSQLRARAQIREIREKHTSTVSHQHFGVDVSRISLPQNQMRLILNLVVDRQRRTGSQACDVMKHGVRHCPPAGVHVTIDGCLRFRATL
jgi:hypothetical protein